MIAFFLEHREEIFRLALEHLSLAGAALGLALIAGVPLGILLSRRRALAPWVLGVTAAVQTIPSPALLGLLMAAPLLGGIGWKPAVTALFLYSLMSVIESIYAGLSSVDPATADAGRGLGMTETQLLTLVELPQALPVLISGLRLSAVWCLGIATVASYIGAGGLGDLIFRGVGRGNYAMVAWGAIPTTVMAVALHLTLTAWERRLRRRLFR